LKIYAIFCVSFEKQPMMGKFSKFIATPIDMLCSNFVKFGRREIGKVVRNLPDKNKFRLADQLSLLYADRAQNLPGPCH